MNIIKVIENGEMEPARVNETFLKLSREFALHKGRMQRNKFVSHVIDGTREDGGDHGLAVSTIPQPLGNRTTSRELLVEPASICLSPIYGRSQWIVPKSLVPVLNLGRSTAALHKTGQ